MASDLASVYSDLDALANASLEELQDIEGVGPNIAEAIVDWFKQPENQKLIQKLKQVGVWPVENLEEIGISLPQTLSGLTFVITGTLPTLSRQEAQQIIKDHGGKVTNSVSNNTSYLVAGEKAGSKLIKAQNLGIPILDEANLWALIRQS